MSIPGTVIAVTVHLAVIESIKYIKHVLHIDYLTPIALKLFVNLCTVVDVQNRAGEKPHLHQIFD